MALPSSYSERQFAEFLREQIEGYADIWGWDNVEADGDYQNAINQTLRTYGVTTINLATDIPKLEAIGLVMVWRKVVRQAASEYDYSTEGQNNTRSQLWKQAREELASAEAAMAAIPGLDPGALAVPPIGIGVIRWRDDPYDYNPQREDVLNGPY